MPQDNPFAQKLQELSKPPEVGVSDVKNPFSIVQEQKEGVLNLGSDKPALARQPSQEYRPHSGLVKTPEPDAGYRRRQAEYYGFGEVPEKHKDAYSNLLDAMLKTLGTEEHMGRVVEKMFGGEAKLANFKGYNAPVIQFDDGTIVAFDQPGIDVQELKGIGVKQVTAEAALGTAGFIGGGYAGPVGAVGGGAAGVGLGAYMAKKSYLKEGKELGYHDLSDDEIGSIARGEGWMAASIELMTFGLGKIFRSGMKNQIAKKLHGMGVLTPDDAKIAADIARRELKDSGTDLTTPQAFMIASREAKGEDAARLKYIAETLEEPAKKILARGESPELAAKQALAAKEKREALDVVEEGLPKTMEGKQVIGEVVVETASQKIAKREGEISKEVSKNIQSAVDKQFKLFDTPGTTVTAVKLREGLSKAREEVFDRLGKEYSKLWDQVPEGVKVDVSSMRETAKKWQRVLNDDFFKSLSEEDEKIVRNALKAGLKKKTLPGAPAEYYAEGFLKKAATEGKEITIDVGGTFNQVSRALSSLKSEQRIMKSFPAFSKAKNKRMLRDLIGELQIARDKSLRDLGPDLADAIRKQDLAYADAKQKIDETIINRIIGKKRAGGWKISEDKTFNALLANPSEMKNILSLSMDPKYAELNVMDTVKKGILSTYKDKVLAGKAEDTMGALTKHKKFMSDNKDVLELMFTPAERTKFSTSGKMEQFIKQETKREKILLNQMKRTIGYKLSNYEPSKVFDAVKGSVDRIKETRKLLKNHPEKLSSFEGLFKKDVVDKVTDKTGDVDLYKLKDVLNKSAGEIKAAVGPKYFNDLKKLSDIVEKRTIPKSQVGALAELFKETQAQTPVAAAWRVIARPLSRLGLATTAGLKLSRSTARKAMGKLLSDPQMLEEAIYVNTHYVKPARMRAFLAGLGLNQIELEDKE